MRVCLCVFLFVFVLVVCQLVYGCFLFVFLLVGGGGRLFACSLWLLGGGVYVVYM